MIFFSQHVVVVVAVARWALIELYDNAHAHAVVAAAVLLMNAQTDRKRQLVFWV